ncbi:hypothetical protein [Bacillus manliponensis]|uniref:hypothetical protein n=1 Tax=Bacillus manliponensis TaxID=574376 RepID=UPI003514734D
MYTSLYGQLLQITESYEKINTLGKKIYEELKQKNVREVQPLQLEQLQQIESVKALSGTFEDTLRGFCREKGIEDVRLSALFFCFSESEIEKIEEIQKKVTLLEDDVKTMLLKNQYYLNVLLKTTEDIVDSVSEYNMERNHNSQIFMDELL